MHRQVKYALSIKNEKMEWQAGTDQYKWNKAVAAVFLNISIPKVCFFASRFVSLAGHNEIGTLLCVPDFLKGVDAMGKEQRRASRTLRAARMAVIVLLFGFILGSAGGGAMAVSQARTLVPVGRAVGIKLFSDGVLVVGLSDIDTETGKAAPAKACGLKEGDIITHINSEEVDTIEQVQSVLNDLEDDQISIRCLRGEKQIQMTTQAVRCSGDGSYKLGAWIRDSMAGIGTMTFYDPASGTFGALGHGISDSDTSVLMPLQSGGIMKASVTDVIKGTKGAPGALQGAFEGGDVGSLQANTAAGVFGTLSDTSCVEGLPSMQIASPTEIKLGAATILSAVQGEEAAEYEVEITRICLSDDGDLRDMMLTVTDSRLLERTGGIVQGMSGSPIIQDGKLVGAVTHVLVNDPTRGYGIFIENMLETANQVTE